MVELQTVWGWQPSLYLFLGGMGAGAFIMAAILHFYDREGSRRIVCASSWAAAICLGLGLLLLVSELTNPLRGMMLWQSFSHFTSWMTFGAWAVFAALIVMGVMALITTRPIVEWASGKWAAFPRIAGKLSSVLAVVGAALGVVVAAYTGILLMSAPGAPLWNTWLLPCLFTVSGIDTGVALVELIEQAIAKRETKMAKPQGEIAEPALKGSAHKLQSRIVVLLVVLELVVLAMLLGGTASSTPVDAASATAQSCAAMLIGGTLAIPFWGLVVVLGLALPLVMAIASLGAKTKRAETYVLAGATGALIGGCALRFLIVMAGSHADYVASTVLHVIS